MPSRNTYVVFTATNARIVKSEEDLKFEEPAILNPSFRQVIGVPPHYWTFVEQAVIPMDADQRLLRDIEMAKIGLINTVHSSIVKVPVDVIEEVKKEEPKSDVLKGVLIGLAIAAAIALVKILL